GHASLDLLAAIGQVATFITRLRLDAHLCAPPPRTPCQRRRSPLVGSRPPTLEHRRNAPATERAPLTVPRWWSQREREVELVLQTAVWLHRGLPPVPIGCVLIRGPQGQCATQALLCTNLRATPRKILW